MEIKFTEVNWATEDFESPFARPLAAELEKSSVSRIGRDLATVCGLARRLTMSKLDILVYIIFDEEHEFKVNDLRCVVIGRDKMETVKDQRYHVLIIHQVGNPPGTDVYERVGVASLKSVQVGSEESWVSIV